MWFRKTKQHSEPSQYPGLPGALDGQAAAMAVESTVADVVLLQSDKGLYELRGPMRSLVPGGAAELREVAELRQVPAMLAGMSATGLRAGAFIAGLSEITGALAALGGKHVPAVLHLTGRTLQRQAGSLHGSHEDCFAAGNAGLALFYAGNVQEVADLALVARRVTELSLVPVICAQDYHATSQSVQSLSIPEPELAWTFLGRPDDLIDPPTPAQAELFAGPRRRIPRLVNLDRPAGVGGVQGSESFFKALAAHRAYFTDPLDGIIREAFRDYAHLTGRELDAVDSYKATDADYLVIAMGAVREDLRAVADAMRAQLGIKAGVLGIRMLRPFPAAEIAERVRGKRGVCVLDRSEMPMTSDAPLTREVRCALDMAQENGSAGSGPAPYPGHPAYARAGERPRLFSGVYSVGAALPSADSLAAVYRHMDSGDDAARRFYVGVDLAQVDRRFPQLQRVQQKLLRDYPGLAQMSLPPLKLEESGRHFSVMRLKALSSEGGPVAGNLFTRALAEAFAMQVRTCPAGTVEGGLQASGVSILFGEAGASCDPRGADTLLVAGRSLVEGLPVEDLVDGGVLVVADNEDARSLWQKFSRRTERWIRDKDLNVYVLDARKLAPAENARHGYMDEKVIWGLLGAGLQLTRDAESVKLCRGYLKELMTALYGQDDSDAEEIPASLLLGAEQIEEMDWRDWPEAERTPVPEPESPWTAVEREGGGGDVFDPVRFWHSTGFLYDIGEPGQALADPQLATAIMPAGSSVHRDMAPYRLHTPKWLPQNCTGCGLCWAGCPDSALPPTLQDVQAVLDTGMDLCKRDGEPMTQLTRIAGHLSKQAHKLVAADSLRQYQEAGSLLGEAFDQLAGKMGLEGDALAAMQADVDLLRARVGSWPFARTERFFEAPESAAKGSGRLVSIAVDATNCKACGLCLEVCPEDAFLWQAPSAENLAAARAHRAFHHALPAVAPQSIAAHLDPRDPDTEVFRLFNREAYHTMVGGDSAYPGNGSKTAVHLITSVLDGEMQSRHAAHVARLEELIEALRAKMQGQLSEAVQINDLEEFAHRLSGLDEKALGTGNLQGLLDPSRSAGKLDKQRLQRLASLGTALQEQRDNYRQGRARLVLAMQQDEITLWSGSYPDNPHENPWLSLARGDGASLAVGLFQGMVRSLGEELDLLRAAEDELKDRAPTKRSAARGWQSLSAEERALVPPVVVIGQASATRWSEVLPLLESGLPLTLAIIDADAGLAGPAERPVHENLAELALELGDVFVLQSSTGHPGHLMGGVAESLSHPGPSLLQVYAPDPVAAGIATEDAMEDGRRAYASRALPLFARDPSKAGGRLTLAGNPDPDQDWTRVELALKVDGGGSPRRVALTLADWAIHQARFRRHFTLVARGHANDRLLPLDTYLALELPDRAGREAYIDVVDSRGQHVIAKVAMPMIQATERSLGVWRRLRERALASDTQDSRPAGPSAQPPAGAAAEGQAAAATPAPATSELVENLLALCGFRSDPGFFNRSLREYLQSQDTAGDASRRE